MSKKFILKHFRGEPVLFTDGRVRDTDYTKYGYRKYELRHGDDFMKPVSIEENVLVNFAGTIISNSELHLDEENWNGSKSGNISKDELSSFYSGWEFEFDYDQYQYSFGGIEVTVSIGKPYVYLDGFRFELKIYDPKEELVWGYAYIFNGWVLPYRRTIQQYVGKALSPGFYDYFDRTVIIPPDVVHTFTKEYHMTGLDVMSDESRWTMKPNPRHARIFNKGEKKDECS
jgi:hypothetical protein